jgi:hypothetical protein
MFMHRYGWNDKPAGLSATAEPIRLYPAIIAATSMRFRGYIIGLVAHQPAPRIHLKHPKSPAQFL